MNLFLKNFGRFLLLNGVVYVFFILVFNYLFESEKHGEECLRNDTRILVTGDSHMHHAIDDTLYPVFENRASESASYFEIYHKLQAILSHPDFNKDNIDAVCISYNYFSLGTSRRYVGDKANYWIDRDQPILRSPSHYPADYGYPINESRLSLLGITYLPKLENLLYFRKSGKIRDWSYYHGSFAKSANDCLIGKQESLEGALSRHYGNLSQSWDPSFLEQMAGYDILCHIADLMKRKKIPLVLINLPQHSDYNARVPLWLVRLHTKCAQDLADAYDTIYLDWHDLPLSNSMFYDYDHLNTQGAKKVTLLLLQELESIKD